MVSTPTGRRDAYQLAVDARDPRFDGVFFVGITTTRVYCRPTCKSRLAYDRHRRFFDSAAAAERAGFRPCLRCRPERAPESAAVQRGFSRAVSHAAELTASRATGARPARRQGATDTLVSLAVRVGCVDNRPAP